MKMDDLRFSYDQIACSWMHHNLLIEQNFTYEINSF